MSDSYPSPWKNSIVMAPSRAGSSYTYNQPRPSAAFSSQVLPPDRDYLDGLVQVPLQTICIPVIDPKQEDVRISDSTYIGSYNWLKEDTGIPTILVPGSPPHWQNRQMPYTIPPDKGIQFCDQNGYRMPKAVLLPLIVAVNKRFEMRQEPLFAWSAVDIVTDRNNLRKLFRWADGTSNTFRIDLQLAGTKTVLMNRFSQRYREMSSGRTYGFSFEKSSTNPAPGCKSSTGHHRIISYDLSGLRVVVRFEVDACTRPPAKYPRRSVSSVDELAASLSAVSLTRQSTFRSEYPLLVREGGIEVPADTVIELATISQSILSSRGFNWREFYPQLFFSQTAQHYLAMHKHGRFFYVTKTKLSSEKLQEEERGLQSTFKKVRKVLDEIKKLVIARGKEGRLSLVCNGGILSVHERESDESLLPDAAMKFFEST